MPNYCLIASNTISCETIHCIVKTSLAEALADYLIISPRAKFALISKLNAFLCAELVPSIKLFVPGRCNMIFADFCPRLTGASFTPVMFHVVWKWTNSMSRLAF